MGLRLWTSRPRSRLVRWLFLRAMGGVHFIAFRSLRRQVLGLIGRRGILPARDLLDAAAARMGPERYRHFPTLLWLDASDEALVRLCRVGEAVSTALVLGVAPRLAAVALWALYLSFVSVGRDFLSFQWDALLLEASLQAALLAPPGLRPGLGRAQAPRGAILLLRWLAFRLHFESGLAKLQSGDPTWRACNACQYHYETQPLPTPLGWYAHHLPARAQRLATASVLGAECGMPLLALGPRKLRRIGFATLLALQVAIAATGNYGFFNLLSAALLLPLLDDEDVLPRLAHVRPLAAPPPSRLRRLAMAILAFPLFALSALRLLARARRAAPPRPVRRVLEAIAPFSSINPYGLFSVMTTERPEIAIEASNDGVSWEEYEFRYKIGDPSRPPRWVAPHQPRLDWQMWFAALGPPPPWFVHLALRLLEGSPDVLALFARVPFGGRPPQMVRAVLYDYRMTDLATRRRSGQYWRRERIGIYLPPVRIAREEGRRSAA